MATLHLTGLDPALVARVRAYAREHGLRLPAAAAYFLARGLRDYDARRAGGLARQARMTEAERAALSATATQARWTDR